MHFSLKVKLSFHNPLFSQMAKNTTKPTSAAILAEQ